MSYSYVTHTSPILASEDFLREKFGKYGYRLVSLIVTENKYYHYVFIMEI
jgi:hypothetical protein